MRGSGNLPIRDSLIALTLVVTLLTIAACDQIFMGQPSVGDLVGMYRLTEASRSFLTTRKRYASLPDGSVELRSDFSIVIRNLPDCAIDGFGDSSGKFISGQGTWEIKKAFPGFGLDLLIDSGGTLPAGGYMGPWIRIRGGRSHYELEFTVGDPDSGETLRYSRQAS